MTISRAPAGGCLAFGTFYEGGEFLPSMDSVAEASRGPSPRQIEAAAKRQERIETDTAKSSHVGKVGERIRIGVTVAVVLVFDGMYGRTYLTIARDDAGNVVVSKGSHWAKEGDAVRIAASVKAHDVREGVKQTVLQRVKVEG